MVINRATLQNPEYQSEVGVRKSLARKFFHRRENTKAENRLHLYPLYLIMDKRRILSNE